MTNADPNNRAARRLDAAAAAYRFKALDPEARWGFKAGSGTTPSQLSCLVATVAVAGGAYLIVGLLRGTAWGGFLWHEMTAYQYIPIPVIVFSIWCFAFLWLKALKIRAQRAVLAAPVLPTATPSRSPPRPPMRSSTGSMRSPMSPSGSSIWRGCAGCCA